MRQSFVLLGLVLLALAVVLPPPTGVPAQMWRAAALGIVMALWWLTEAVPLPATALLPLALWPPMAAVPVGDVAAHYAHPLVFLFLGGFLLARAIERWGVHKRIAHAVVRISGTGQPGRLGAVMGATAFLSLWISNTAAAMVMAPIAAAVALESADTRFACRLMLGVAFAATIGGMGSLIGTPPNAIYAAYLEQELGKSVGFAEWAAVGVPVSVVMLVISWLLLSRSLDRGARGRGAADTLPPPGPGEIRVAIVAALTALAWVARPGIEWLAPGVPLSDTGIALIAALALFLLPSGEDGPLLDWETAHGIRWDVLILFGGGLALAGILDQTGLVQWIADRMTALQALPILAVILVLAAMIVAVGELASNTAMAAIVLPVGGAIAVSLGVDPARFTLPLALAASIGFMLPVATPPNAIVFGHPAVTRRAMIAQGAPLDLIGVVVASVVGYLLSGWFL